MVKLIFNENDIKTLNKVGINVNAFLTLQEDDAIELNERIYDAEVTATYIDKKLAVKLARIADKVFNEIEKT